MAEKNRAGKKYPLKKIEQVKSRPPEKPRSCKVGPQKNSIGEKYPLGFFELVKSRPPIFLRSEKVPPRKNRVNKKYTPRFFGLMQVIKIFFRFGSELRFLPSPPPNTYIYLNLNLYL